MTGEKTLSLLTKLKAMAQQTASPAEAAVAAAQLQRLMLQHKISEAEIADPDDGDEIVVVDAMDQGQRQPTSWRLLLLAAIARGCFCRVTRLASTTYGQRGAMNVWGRQGDVEAVLYQYRYLCREVDRLADEGWAEERHVLSLRMPSARGWKHSFRRGAVATIARRLDEQQAADRAGLSSQSTALVRQADAAVARAVEERCGKLKTAKIGGKVQASGYNAGRLAAHSVNLTAGRGRLGAPAPQLTTHKE
jgi:hypothetical protein